jgi:putative intracellular protease/amidase
MRIAILVPPRDFKDETLSRLKPMLEKWGVKPVISSYSTHELVGYHGAVYKTELNAAHLAPEDFDALVIADGPGVDEYKLYDFRNLLDTVKLFSMRGKLIAAVGNGIKVIARANIIAKVKISRPADEETRRLVALYHGIESKEQVQFDSNILTLGNTEGTLAFADALLYRLGAK